MRNRKKPKKQPIKTYKVVEKKTGRVIIGKGTIMAVDPYVEPEKYRVTLNK